MKSFYKLLMMSFVYGSLITFLYVFVSAYHNENKQIIVDINSVGEANLEMFILWPIVLFCGTYLFIDYFNKSVKEVLDEQKL